MLDVFYLFSGIFETLIEEEEEVLRLSPTGLLVVGETYHVTTPSWIFRWYIYILSICFHYVNMVLVGIPSLQLRK